MVQPPQPPEIAAAALRLSPAQLAFELARPWLFFGAFVVASWTEHWWLALPLALATFLAGFVQLHDAMHNALGLSKPANERVLVLAGILILKSGHGLRVTHLRHHGRCLDADDPEGRVVHWPLWRVMIAGPFHVLGNRGLAMRLAPRTARDQIGETVVNAITAAVAITIWYLWASPAGLLYWAVVAAMSATLALWAAYIPHVLSPAHPLIRLAGLASRGWTPVINSFAYHDLHHQFPKVPTALLGSLARVVGPEIAYAGTTVHRPPSAP